MSTSTASEQPVKIKLSQWDALSLESLRSLGWTDQELLGRILEGTLPVDTSRFKFDYVSLSAWARDNEAEFQQVLREGYQIKYNTIRGISSWIAIALNIEAELHLEPGQEAVIARLTPQEAERVSAVLSFGWKIVSDESEASAQQLDQPSQEDARSLYVIIPAPSATLPATGA